MMSAPYQVWDNGRAVEAPLLSVVVPYKDYDVGPLATELLAQAAAQTLPVELLFADDGSQQRSHAERLRALFSCSAIRCRLLLCEHNVGRSVIRNRLAQAAQGAYLLYLDADMLPDDAGFLQRYLDHAKASKLDIVCGGRSYRRLQHCHPSQQVYRHFSLTTECVTPDVRNRRAMWYLLTNNLMLRRTLALAQPFDEAYRGWGFEDADWALRLRGVVTLHIDNSASHMDLPDERQLLSKYAASTDNFRRIYREVPEFRRFALSRASRLFAWLPLPARWLRAIAHTLVVTPALPIKLRYLGVHAYRAATYAGVLRADAVSRLATRVLRRQHSP